MTRMATRLPWMSELHQELYAEMEAFAAGLQSEICEALERLDGAARFGRDAWTREGGGGGMTRILTEGAVFEKGGVGFSSVHGELSDAFAARLAGAGRRFAAVGISLVIHPRSPFVPAVHANFRFIVQGDQAWFGGGADLTPWYLFDEDAAHFHQTLKAACDRHGASQYPRFKKSCDDYFVLEHRGERRGVGGVFFENLGGELPTELALAKDLGGAFLPAYLPIVERRRALPFTAAQREWQEIRRGRYVEFNLLHDRGTVFGLQTGGRVESILMSLPPRVRWVYDHQPAPASSASPPAP
jgi:coproporphyrinogen III oxidase